LCSLFLFAISISGRIEVKITLQEAEVHNLTATVEIHVQTTLILEKLEAVFRIQKNNKTDAGGSKRKEQDTEQ